jgi:DNA-binding MarR family transcriptional regulator
MTVDPALYRDLSDFRYALRRFLAAAEAVSKSAGVTQQQYQALLAVKTWPAATMAMKDLAEQLLLTHHAAVQLVDRLSRAGLARRAPSLGDRRSVLLQLTPAGDTLMDALAAQHMHELLRQEPMLSRSLRRVRRKADRR